MGDMHSEDPGSPIETEPPRPAAGTVVITGVSGFLGQAVLRRLAGSASVGRLVGLDVREPGFAPRSAGPCSS
jgi:nucleoside-diphosphate-sugar epimerase